MFRLACWFGLVLGFVELSARWALWRFLHKLPLGLTHPQAAWMTLASDLLVYASLGALLAAVAWCWPRLVPLWLASAVYTVLFFYCLGDVVEVRKWPAAVVLGVGLAAFGARSAERLGALARRTLRPLAGAALALGVGVYGWGLLGEYRATAALPAAAARAPNLLLITLDTVRADRLSLYGYQRATSPRLEEYAKRGVVFDQAISTVSWTLPSHASMFTGHFPQDIFHGSPRTFNNGWETPMDGGLPTLAEYLDRHGYETAGFVANWTFCDRLYGLGRGFTRYVDYNPGLEQMLGSGFLTQKLANAVGARLDPRFVLARKDGLTVNREFLQWLDGVHGRPFFAFLNYMETHDPYNPPPGFAGRFSSGRRPAAGESAGAQLSPAEAAAVKDDYDCCLAALDDHVGRLLDELKRRGVADNTVVIITADHGEHLGEGGRYGHGDTLYMPVLHVPLLVISPDRVPAGVRVRGPASLRNLAATMVDLVGLSDGAPFPGTSLRGRWDGTHLPAEPAYSNLDMMANLTGKTKAVRLQSLVGDRYHYIEGSAAGIRELYDLVRDPAEEHDLAADPSEEDVEDYYHAEIDLFHGR